MDLSSRTESVLYNVTSTQSIESSVIQRNVGDVWEALRSFSYDRVFSSSVKKVNFTSGSPSEVGSIFEIEYTDGAVWTFRLVELSELKRSFSYELISATPEITFSSLLNRVRLFRVTDDNSTFIRWETNYSSDVNSSVVQDGKYKKLDYFRDLKKFFENRK